MRSLSVTVDRLAKSHRCPNLPPEPPRGPLVLGDSVTSHVLKGFLRAIFSISCVHMAWSAANIFDFVEKWINTWSSVKKGKKILKDRYQSVQGHFQRRERPMTICQLNRIGWRRGNVVGMRSGKKAGHGWTWTVTISWFAPGVENIQALMKKHIKVHLFEVSKLFIVSYLILKYKIKF